MSHEKGADRDIAIFGVGWLGDSASESWGPHRGRPSRGRSRRDAMPRQPSEPLPTGEPAPSTGPLVAMALIAFAGINLFILGWFAPAIVTRSESSAGFRACVSAVFGNAPTAGRVFAGRAR